jgi:hypothetical protein
MFLLKYAQKIVAMTTEHCTSYLAGYLLDKNFLCPIIIISRKYSNCKPVFEAFDQCVPCLKNDKVEHFFHKKCHNGHTVKPLYAKNYEEIFINKKVMALFMKKMFDFVIFQTRDTLIEGFCCHSNYFLGIFQ